MTAPGLLLGLGLPSESITALGFTAGAAGVCANGKIQFQTEARRVSDSQDRR